MRRYINEYFSLEDAVVEELERKRPDFGYNGFGEFIFYRTYSRTKHNGRQENWADVVVRVINGVLSIRKEHYVRNRIEWDEKRWQDYAAEMAFSMFDMKWLPPGRGLWAMGTAFVVERGAMALYNCLNGDTKFLDGDRLVRLRDRVGHVVRVKGSDGEYHDAEVKNFGRQKLCRLQFRPECGNYISKYRYRVQATRNHRWLLSDGTVTDYIREGDKITASCNQDIDQDSYEFRRGYVHGLIFADGTQDCHYKERFYIRLCGQKQDELETIKKDLRFHLEGQQSGEPRLTLLSQTNLKEVPEECESLEYKAGFAKGWCRFDGHESESYYGLDTQDFSAAKWFEEYSGILGYVVIGRSEDNKPTNFGPRSSPLIRLRYCHEDVVYRLVSIDEFAPEEDVFCVVEPETQTFQLHGGFVTGNCAATKLGGNDRFANDCHWLMDSLMLGVGVGFEALRDDLKLYRPAGSFQYEIPDTREGWCDSVRLLLEAYTQSSRYEPEFDYSKIRKQGELIRGFGGQASGPEPLIRLHDDIRRLCTTPGLSPLRLKTDIANKIGCCVVAGNVRRSAELAKGDIKDREFMDLKDYERYPERENFGWMSNNTVALNDDEDFERLGEVARRVITRGEPGIMNLRNMRLARIGKDMRGLREDDADLLNP
jgi:ribonucleotide reductase alpha subunit